MEAVGTRSSRPECLPEIPLHGARTRKSGGCSLKSESKASTDPARGHEGCRKRPRPRSATMGRRPTAGQQGSLVVPLGRGQRPPPRGGGLPPLVQGPQILDVRVSLLMGYSTGRGRILNGYSERYSTGTRRRTPWILGAALPRGRQPSSRREAEKRLSASCPREFCLPSRRSRSDPLSVAGAVRSVNRHRVSRRPSSQQGSGPPARISSASRWRPRSSSWRSGRR